MALLDYPLLLVSAIDMRLASLLPDAMRVVLWGALGAALSMGLYWLISPQRRLTQLAAEERRLKEALRDDETSMTEGLASARRLFHLALARLGLVLPPVLIAALPIVCLATWLEIHYGFDFPTSGQPAAVHTVPDTVQGRWIAADDTPPRIEILDEQGVLLQFLTIDVPVPFIQKRAWWNLILGNPLGYLADDSPVERIDIDLPPKAILSRGPDWVRSWAPIFFASVLAASLLIKFVFRIR